MLLEKTELLDNTALVPVGYKSRPAFNDAAIDIHIVEPGKEGSYELLKAAYGQLFRKFFSDEVYQEPLKKWRTRLEAVDAPSDYIIGISGTNLNDPEKRVLMGMFVAIYYKKASTGLLAYNIVDTPWQSTGLGRHQIEIRKTALLQAAARNNQELRGLFAECNDPEIVSEDIMDPKKRLEIYARIGGKRVPINYKCPSGADIGDKLGNMMLLAFPHPKTGAYPDFQGVSSFLRGTYFVRGLNPDTDGDFHRMLNEMRRAHMSKNGRNVLLPLVNDNGRYDKRLSSLKLK